MTQPPTPPAAPPDFIEVYEDALDATTCRAFIQRFEASGQARRGETGSGLDLTLKNSWDIRLDEYPAWADVKQRLNEAAFVCIKRYLRRYAHAALAPLQLKMPDRATGGMVVLDAQRLAALDEKLLDELVATIFRPGGINLQKYIAGEGGYPYWHSEVYPRHDMGEALHRVVLWTVYLNDEFTAGETEFLYQGRRIVPRTGSLLIAPTSFTHTHRGNRPEGGNKYIATSWMLFQRAEKLYGAPQPAKQK